LAVVDGRRPETVAVPIEVDEIVAADLGGQGQCGRASNFRVNDNFGLLTTDDGRLFVRQSPEAGVLITLAAA